MSMTLTISGFRSTLAGLVLCALAIPGFAHAEDLEPNRLNIDKALELSQAAIGTPIPDYTFLDTSGKEVRVSDFRGKPLAITFIYTSCSSSCPTITTHIVEASKDAEEALGAGEFNVISIGYDAPVDKPEAMAAFRDLYAVKSQHWKFLSGDLLSVTGLADSLGYTFVPATENEGFEHLAQVTILDKEGKVYRQVYGDNFPLPNFVEPLKEVAFGTKTPFASVDDLVNKVRLFCIVYDPRAGVYYFDYTPFVAMGAGLTMILVMGYFVIRNTIRLTRRDRDGTA